MICPCVTKYVLLHLLLFWRFGEIDDKTFVSLTFHSSVTNINNIFLFDVFLINSARTTTPFSLPRILCKRFISSEYLHHKMSAQDWKIQLACVQQASNRPQSCLCFFCVNWWQIYHKLCLPPITFIFLVFYCWIRTPYLGDLE